jgi:hypothetical protein
MSKRSKILSMVQALFSLLIIAVVVARATAQKPLRTAREPLPYAKVAPHEPFVSRGNRVLENS